VVRVAAAGRQPPGPRKELSSPPATHRLSHDLRAACCGIDDTADPIAVDYLDLRAKHRGTVSRGIMEWVGDDARFLMAPPGAPRPAAFTDAPPTGTLSRWRRRS